MRASAAGGEPARIPSRTWRCSSASAAGVCQAGPQLGDAQPDLALERRVQAARAAASRRRRSARRGRPGRRRRRRSSARRRRAPRTARPRRAPRGCPRRARRACGRCAARAACARRRCPRPPAGVSSGTQALWFGPALQQPLVDEQLQRLAHRRPRDAVAADELELGQPGARRDVAAQDPVAQRAGERLGRRDGLELEAHERGGERAAGGEIAASCARRRGRACPSVGGRRASSARIGRRRGTHARRRARRRGRARRAARRRGPRAVTTAANAPSSGRSALSTICGLGVGHRDDGDLEALERGPHADERTARRRRRAATASAPGGAQRNAALGGERVDRRGEAAELRLERAQAPRERAGRGPSGACRDGARCS